MLQSDACKEFHQPILALQNLLGSKPAAAEEDPEPLDAKAARQQLRKATGAFTAAQYELQNAEDQVANLRQKLEEAQRKCDEKATQEQEARAKLDAARAELDEVSKRPPPQEPAARAVDQRQPPSNKDDGDISDMECDEEALQEDPELHSAFCQQLRSAKREALASATAQLREKRQKTELLRQQQHPTAKDVKGEGLDAAATTCIERTLQQVGGATAGGAAGAASRAT